MLKCLQMWYSLITNSQLRPRDVTGIVYLTVVRYYSNQLDKSTVQGVINETHRQVM